MLELLEFESSEYFATRGEAYDEFVKFLNKNMNSHVDTVVNIETFWFESSGYYLEAYVIVKRGHP